MINFVINYLEKNKIFDIVSFDSNILDADIIIFASGISKKQLCKITINLLSELKKRYVIRDICVCGRGSDWIAIDLHTVIIHLMLPSVRSYYNLEEIYGNF